MKATFLPILAIVFLAGCGQPAPSIKSIQEPVTIKIEPQAPPPPPKITPDKSGDDASDLKAAIEASKKTSKPRLSFRQLATGQVGSASWATVISVVGESDVLVATDTAASTTFWLTDYPTIDLTDRKRFRIEGMMIVQGRHQCNAVSGAVATVFVLRPIKAEIVDKAKAASESDSAYPSK
jgi:hypothetical protein